jgi:hypothetical protein
MDFREPQVRITIEAGTARPCTAILLAMDTKAMQMHIAPGEEDLQRGMEAGQGHVAADEEPAPDEGADSLHDHTDLIDAGWERGMFHGSSVLQESQYLKRLPPESNALMGPRQGQGCRQGEKLIPLGAAVDGTVFVRIDFAPCPIRAVPLQGARAHAQYEHGPQSENCQSLLHPLP